MYVLLPHLYVDTRAGTSTSSVHFVEVSMFGEVWAGFGPGWNGYQTPFLCFTFIDVFVSLLY